MKKEVNPLALAGIVTLAVVVLGVFAFKMLQPTPYQPSPGASGANGQDPWLLTHPNKPAPSAVVQPGSDGKPYYPSAPAGSIPGRPPGSPPTGQ